MPSIDILLQNLSNNDAHVTAIRELLSEQEMEGFFLCLAYVRQSGVAQLRSEFQKIGDSCSAYVGIRNGVTSSQGLTALLETGIRVYAVDTACTDILYHPKVYAGFNDKFATVILGSANLTRGGLINNIEASVRLRLNRLDRENEESFQRLNSVVTTLPSKYPDHVFKLKEASDIAALQDEGRVVDEQVHIVTQIMGPITKSRDKLNRFPVVRHSKALPPTSQQPLTPPPSGTGYLVWESKPLTERDLNIPKGGTTNATGSMGFKKGRLDEIDQRHYFRDVIFANLNWKFDSSPGKTHLERSEANFHIQIKGVYCGAYSLNITHNSDTTSRTYRQNNFMTQIHWGLATPLIAQNDLLDRTLRLYSHAGGRSFTIQID